MSSAETHDVADPFGGRLVDLAGDGRSRGTTHGETLRQPIAEALERWRHAIAEREQRKPDEYIRDFLGSTGFVRTVSRLTPGLYAEVLAIAAASNQPVDDVIAYNLMDEEWRHNDGSTGCSVIGTVLDSGDTLLSQNMDLPKTMGTSQAILRIAADRDRPARLVLTAAGMIGLFGVNSDGVGCCVNTLSELPSTRTGMPVAFIVRSVLEHRDAAAAGEYLRSVPHASGQHYGIADRHGLRGYEGSAAGCVAGPQDDHLVHTNHPLWGDASTETETEDKPPTTSRARLRALEDGLGKVRASGDVEPLLSSRDTGLCVLPIPDKRAATFCSAEFTLTSPPSVRVALGRPDTAPWHPVPWPT